jgi:putative phage-type endonuclease
LEITFEMMTKNEDICETTRRVLATSGNDDQRSIEWLRARASMLTASDVYSAMGCNGASVRSHIIKNKVALLRSDPSSDPSSDRSSDPNARKESSPALDWGVKSEDHIRRRLETKFGVRIFEVGLVKHVDYPWLGASIDGITAHDSISDEYGLIKGGTVVEIKAPWIRPIVDGQIPDVYFAQVQVQLACLDLEHAMYVEYRHCWPSSEQFNIVRIDRDRDWFERHLPDMCRFHDDLSRCLNVKTEEDGVCYMSKRCSRRSSVSFIDGLYDQQPKSTTTRVRRTIEA